MRRRGCRGQAIEFDKILVDRVETMRKELGYYPSLRMIGRSFTPPYSQSHIFNRLRFLAANSRLSEGAAEVYQEKLKTIKKFKKNS